MINELYKLSEEIDKAGIEVQNWHRKYKPIPNVREKAPCVRVTISGGNVVEVSSVSKDIGTALRKFGSNQGTYPCMNLAPLYRITDEKIKRALSNISPENLDNDGLEKIKGWCKENNWGKKFQGKYRISMENTPNELLTMAPEFEPLKILTEESKYFSEPMTLHRKLEEAVFEMLDRRENVSLALKILFYPGKSEKEAVDDFGTLSVALETPRNIDMGVPVTSRKFVLGLNKALMAFEELAEKENESGIYDAFGIQFKPIEEPMPEVKLAGGFDVKLRTMFKEQRCQTRYGRIENASYPISPLMRKKLQAALDWLGNAEHKDETWININQNEILFVYPANFPEKPISFVGAFGPSRKDKTSFSQQVKLFIEDLKKGKRVGEDSNADWIQLFILRKIDKGRRKVVYTRQTDTKELEKCSEAWTIGCSNLPILPFGKPNAPFPLDAADILNYFWKQNGEMATDNFKPVPKYHV